MEVILIFADISDDYIKKVLKKHDSMMEYIYSRIHVLYDEMLDADGLIKSIAIGKHTYGNIGGGHSGVKEDVLSLVIKHGQLARQRTLEIRAELWRLTEEEETINRIWVCYRTLRGMECEVITALYVEGRLYKDVETHTNISHKTFEKIRQRGIKKIKDLYHSKLSNVDIVTKNDSYFSGYSKRGRKKKADYEQLDLKFK